MLLSVEPGVRTGLSLGLLGPLGATLDGVEVPLGGRRRRAVAAVTGLRDEITASAVAGPARAEVLRPTTRSLPEELSDALARLRPT